MTVSINFVVLVCMLVCGYVLKHACAFQCVCGGGGGDGAEGCSNFKVNNNNRLNNHVKLPAVRDKERRQCIFFY